MTFHCDIFLCWSNSGQAFFSGAMKHEETSPAAIDAVFDFIDTQLKTRTGNRKRPVKEIAEETLEGSVNFEADAEGSSGKKKKNEL